MGWGWGGNKTDTVKQNDWGDENMTDNTDHHKPEQPMTSSASSSPHPGNIKGRVMKIKSSEVPEGAYWLNPSTVAKYYREQIDKWKPESDV